MRPLSPPDFSGVLPEHLIHAMHRCELGKGDEVLAHFESDFSELTDSTYCVATSSATAGIHLALIALGVGEGDVVICPTFTFAASAFPILYQKAIPVFVDSETDSWNISPEYLEEAIKQSYSNGKKPKAVIVVHGFGNPAKLNEIIAICHQYDIPLVEDAANALGSTFEGRQVGGFGRIGVFSFNRNKIVSAAGGGCLVTNDKNIADKVRYFAHQAKSNASYYQHTNVGYNYGLSPILAEVVRVQLATLEERVLERRHLFSQYVQTIVSDTFWQTEISKAYSNRWLSVVGFDEKGQANEIIETAQKQQVEVARVWKPMHMQPVFENALYVGNKESERFFLQALCLPFSTKLMESYHSVLSFVKK